MRPSSRSTKSSIALTLFAHADGHHEAAWRRPGADPLAPLRLGHWLALARRAEGAALDAVFLADNLALPAHAGRRSQPGFDPFTLLAALAPATDDIALVGTASTSYVPPYLLARGIASLDTLSGGRAGWNLVTSAYEGEALNLGHRGDGTHTARAVHEDRYARAEDVLAAVEALWRSFPPDAVVADRDGGWWLDPDRVRPVDHDGPHVATRGPLNVPGPRRGRPLLVQAGSSPTGAAFAARHADVVFTAQSSLEDAVAFRAGLREQVAAAGRDPDAVAVLPGLGLVLGTSVAAAEETQDQLDDLVQPEHAVAQLGHVLDRDLSALALDEPLPAEVLDAAPVEGMQSRAALLLDTARREGLTLRRLAVRVATGRGHLTVTGDAAAAADVVEEWVGAGAADGFNLMPARLPEDLDLAADHLVPELRRRGLFRTGYDGSTLLDQLDQLDRLDRLDRSHPQEAPR